MGIIDQIGSTLASGVSSVIGGLPGTAFNLGLNSLMQNQQSNQAKDLMKYQWDKFQSPKAQVESMAAAGLNPAVTLGGHGSFASPSLGFPANNGPIQIDGVSDMLGSLTQLKKVDKENDLIDQQIYKTLSEKDLLDEQRHGLAIANTILAAYGDKKAAAEIANLGGQTALYAAEKDLAKANESLTKLKEQTEKISQALLNQNKLKAALEVKNYQRYIESVIKANNSGAKNSEAQAHLADVNAKGQEILNDINGSEEGRQALIDELEQRAKKLKQENKLNKETTRYLSALADLAETNADWATWNQILNSTSAAANLVFEGIGAFTKLGMLRNASKGDVETTDQVRFDADGNYIGHTETRKARSKR